MFCSVSRMSCPFSSGLNFSVLAAALAGFSAFLSRKLVPALRNVVYNPRKFLRTSRNLWEDEKGEIWFSEVSNFWEGQSFSIKVEKIILESRSKYQDILIFESERYGTVFVLDGAIQVTTLDECSYQEVMTHTPIQLVASDRKIKRVLVIGGGDGGVLREIAKYSDIEQIHICEIDEMVIDVAKKYLPQLAIGYSDDRVQIHVQDGFLFLEECIRNGELFDVIISDLSDPIGPAESVFNGGFIDLLSQALNPDHGVACLQGECYWLHSELIQKLTTEGKRAFAHCEYASIAIPTYPCGQIGAIIMTKNNERLPSIPVRGFENMKKEAELVWYSHDLHRAQFVLPPMVKKLVFGSL
jgi:spermidine synthase